MVEMDPSNEELEEEVHFTEQKATGIGEEIKSVTSFEDAWQQEQEYRRQMKMRSLQSSVGSGFCLAFPQELPPSTRVYERKRKAAFPPSPPKEKVCPSPSRPAAGKFLNCYTPPQQLRHRQGPAEHRRSSPQKLQFRGCLFHRPLFPFPNGQQTFAQDLSYRQNSAMQAMSQQPQPSQFPDHKILPDPLDSLLQSSLTQRPMLRSPVELEGQQNSTRQAVNRCPQPRKSHDLQITPWEGPQSSSSQMSPRWCDLCNVPCMNDSCYKQHRQGKKHKAKWEEAFGNSKDVEMKKHKLVWCEECSIPCVNEFALAQHLVGKKHALRLFDLQLLNAGGPEAQIL